VSEGNYREALQLVQHAMKTGKAFYVNGSMPFLKTGPVAQTKWVEEISAWAAKNKNNFFAF
jgi:DNA polymerase-3 subunit delta'